MSSDEAFNMAGIVELDVAEVSGHSLRCTYPEDDVACSCDC